MGSAVRLGTVRAETMDLAGTTRFRFWTNNVIWQNRSFFIGVGSFGTGTRTSRKQSLCSTRYWTPATSQASDGTSAGGRRSIGACPAASYWDIGVRGDSGPSNHAWRKILCSRFLGTDQCDGLPASQ